MLRSIIFILFFSSFFQLAQGKSIILKSENESTLKQNVLISMPMRQSESNKKQPSNHHRSNHHRRSHNFKQPFPIAFNNAVFVKKNEGLNQLKLYQLSYSNFAYLFSKEINPPPPKIS